MKKLIPIFLILSVFVAGCNFANQTPTQQEKPLTTTGDKALDQKFYDQAVQANDLTLCNQILDATMKSECTSIANAGQLTSEAVSKADLSLCRRIDLARYRVACESQVQPLLNAKQASEDRMQIDKQAYDQKNYKLCDQIADENQKVSCKYNVITDEVIAKKDPSLCEAIGQKDIVDKCKALVQ
ncbi:hypothetical protein COY05_03360 [Candidatus Peregrinibacteria bacterium CG_4_10_14_0_2_um_filter_38_24]|nr:MAG: hypothetical protein COY05_03360 [Candidatus Peregrinibacteria bacterium CG_4_10_14_0_2_um_filter_38_24]